MHADDNKKFRDRANSIALQERAARLKKDLDTRTIAELAVEAQARLRTAYGDRTYCKIMKEARQILEQSEIQLLTIFGWLCFPGMPPEDIALICLDRTRGHLKHLRFCDFLKLDPDTLYCISLIQSDQSEEG